MAFLFQMNGVSSLMSIQKVPKITHLCPCLLIEMLLLNFGPQWWTMDQFEAENRPHLKLDFNGGQFKLIWCIISEIHRPRHFSPIWAEIVELHLYQETRTKMGDFRNLPDGQEWWNTIHLREEGHRCSIFIKLIPYVTLTWRNWLGVFHELRQSCRHPWPLEL